MPATVAVLVAAALVAVGVGVLAVAARPGPVDQNERSGGWYAGSAAIPVSVRRPVRSIAA